MVFSAVVNHGQFQTTFVSDEVAEGLTQTRMQTLILLRKLTEAVRLLHVITAKQLLGSFDFKKSHPQRSIFVRHTYCGCVLNMLVGERGTVTFNVFKRTCLPVSYGATEAVMGEVNGLHRARGVVVSEGHQSGVVNHLRKPRRWRVPLTQT